jgi:hypothetical protein
VQGQPRVTDLNPNARQLPTTVIPTVREGQSWIQRPLIPQVGGVQPASTYNPYGLEVQSNAPQSIPNATFTPLVFPVKVFTGLSWNAATNTWTIPIAGRYTFSARASLLIGGAGSVITYFISLWGNGLRIFNGQGALYTQPAGGFGVTLSSILVVDHDFNQGDQVQIQGWHNYGVAQSTVGSTLEDWWTAHLISTSSLVV